MRSISKASASQAQVITFLVLLLGWVLGCSPARKSNGANQPPQIESISLRPEQPSTDAQINLEVKGQDPDGDMLTYRVEWVVNGQVMASGPILQFSTRGLAPGDQVYARVQALDGEGQSPWVETARVVLYPKLIGLDSLTLEPRPLTSELTAIRAIPHAPPGASDQIRYVYRWTIDGKVLADSGSTISVSSLKIGQRVTVEAVPVLGIERGRPFRVEAKVLGPAPELSGVEFVSEDGPNYIYLVKASDPQKEPLTYLLVQAPPGTSIDPGSGRLTIPKDNMGEIWVRVTNRSGSWTERRLDISP